MSKSFFKDVRAMIYTSLFTALIILGSYISVPTGLVPVVLSNMFIFISCLLLGSKWGFISVFIYILLGALGLPVFSGGNGGLHHLYGPTGGYLIGFMVASWVIGKISRIKRNALFDGIALFVGASIINVLGIVWLKWQFPQGWEKALLVYWVFILADIIKIIFALYIVRYLRPVIKI